MFAHDHLEEEKLVCFNIFYLISFFVQFGIDLNWRDFKMPQDLCNFKSISNQA